MNSVHHLTDHWVDEDEGLVGLHHHLKEVWVDETEDEGTALTPGLPDIGQTPA